MSRSGYSDDLGSEWAMICWRGAVASAIRGKRGQAFLREMAAAMDAMLDKRLIAHELAEGDQVCAIGSVGKARGVDMSKIDPEEREQVADAFKISPALAAEIVYENDESYFGYKETPEQRFARMRKWIDAQIRKDDPQPLAS